VVELVGGGSVINRAYPVHFFKTCIMEINYLNIALKASIFSSAQNIPYLPQGVYSEVFPSLDH
jgi:hypothetical protein